jgi:PPK2 family polyphosphate:nucleotide phosphotransferase
LKIDSKVFLVQSGDKVKLKELPTIVMSFAESKKDYKEILKHHAEKLSSLQYLRYASGQYSLLLIFQGMDAAGKDGAIRHVPSGVDPQGCQVSSFKEPTAAELKHDFLWRTTCRLPERGQIAIFNRSYYEEVLIVQVHPEILRNEGLPDELLNEKTIWKERYRSITEFEEHLHRNGTQVVKIFLHLSKAEQAKRFRERMDTPERNWKFSLADLKEREHWDQYMMTYEACLESTSTQNSPWYIVPADDKENARIIVSQIILDSFDKFRMKYPRSSEQRHKELESIRKKL